MVPADSNRLFIQQAPSCEGYPFKKHRKIAFINSTGICNLNCEYCFTNDNKRPVSITKADMDTLFEAYGENFLICFSGQGDFFAGYQKKDRFLEHVLSHDVQVYLDFNAALVHELFDIDAQLLNKILQFDVSYHYETMHQKKLLEGWTKNVIALAKHVDDQRWAVKGIVAMCNLERLGEKLEYYAQNVFPETQKKLKLVLDDFDNTVHTKPVLKFVSSLISKYPDEVVQEEFAELKLSDQTVEQRFVTPTTQKLHCPAGSMYFKISFDGQILPCNKMSTDFGISLGNLKQGNPRFITNLIPCSPLCGPGCIYNWDKKYPHP